MIVFPIVFLLVSYALPVHSYNFLVYNPLFGHSHATFFGKIADALTEAGHNVTVLMPICDKRLVDKVGLKATKDVIMFELSEEQYRVMDAFDSVLHESEWEDGADPRFMLKIANAFGDLFATTCRDVFDNKELLQQLKVKKFDAGITEVFHICGLGLLDHLEIPSTIGASSGTNLDAISRMIGQPVAPSFVPGSTSTFSDKMTLAERAVNAISSLVEGVFFSTIFGKEHAVLREKNGPNFYSIEELVSRMSFNLVNSNPYLDFPLPVIQKTIAIGGISVNLNKKQTLSKEWNDILDRRPNSVLISFGSVAQSCKMPERYKNSLLEVFASMPETTFIWKYESDDTAFAAHLDNVVLSKWVPQPALLADPRLSFFVTHGGLGSVNELAHLGKKALVIPLFGDQPHNSQMLARHGGAELLTKFDLAKPKVIREAFQKLLNSSSYSENAKRLSEMLQNQPIPAKELLVKHCEFAARFGKLPSLDPQGRHLSFIQYFLLDVFACGILIVVGIIAILVVVIKKLITRFSKVKKD